VAEQTDGSHVVAALILLGLILAAIAAGIGATWIDDGDGTCGALYKPNLSRMGCTRKLLPAGLVAGVLGGGAVLAWDAARRKSHRPSRGAVICVAISLVTVCALMVVRSATERAGVGGHAPGAAPTPTTAPSAQTPPSAPVVTPLTVLPR
jgi:hypothetical protein